MTTGSLIKENKLIGVRLQFQKLSPLSSWQRAWKQADVVLEKELRVLHLNLQAAEGGYVSTLSIV